MANASAEIERLAGEGKLIAYVGYGSLVNIQTHRTPSLGAVPVHLKGWRRFWCAYGEESQPNAAFLSGIEAPDCTIEALLVYDHIDSLPALDEREVHYDRLVLHPTQLAAPTPLMECPIFIYRAQKIQPAASSSSYLLQSYIDAVLLGYEAQFGAGAVERFIQTTDHWALPLQRDRAAPIYPRSVAISPHDAKRFDDHLHPLVKSENQSTAPSGQARRDAL